MKIDSGILSSKHKIEMNSLYTKRAYGKTIKWVFSDSQSAFTFLSVMLCSHVSEYSQCLYLASGFQNANIQYSKDRYM